MARPLTVRTYAQALAVVAQWPKSPLKEGLDLGPYLRRLVQQSFPQGENSAPVSDSVARQLGDYQRLAESAHQRAHPRLYPEVSLSRLNREELDRVTSPGVIEELDRHIQGLWWWQRIRLR